MEDGDRLRRSRDAVVGGVCAGIADYLSVDPVVVRIWAVILACLTAGVAVVVYAGLWCFLPLEPETFAACEVVPESARSEAYGAWENSGSDSTRAAECHTEGGWFFSDIGHPDGIGTAHLPPLPPATAAWADSSRMWLPGSAPCDEVSMRELEKRIENKMKVRRRHLRRIVVAVSVASLALCIVLASVLGTCVDGVETGECWPLMLSILGILRLVIPSVPGKRAFAFVAGIALFFSGAALFLMATDILTWESLAYMVRDLWFLLALVAFMFAYGAVSGSHRWVAAAGVCLAAFFVVGLAWYAVPGDTASLVLSVPGGFVRHFVIPATNG